GKGAATMTRATDPFGAPHRWITTRRRHAFSRSSLCSEPLALLVPTEPPARRKPRPGPPDLAACRLLLSNEACADRPVVEQALGAHGPNPYSGIEIGSLDGLVAAVRERLAVAIISAACVTPRPPDMAVRRPNAPELALPVGLATEQPAAGTSRL